jgi:protocatechuate 3,4-dioxygenase beta subunit
MCGVRKVVPAACLVAVLVVGASSATAPVAAAARCTPTLDDGAGPFGRGAPPLRSKIGTGHVLTGLVLSTDCRPIAGARVHLWQSNRRGVYTLAGSGTVVTNRFGRFRFEGPPPVSYEGRPPHIHLRIIARDHEVLLTRYVRAPGARSGSIRVVLRPVGV